MAAAGIALAVGCGTTDPNPANGGTNGTGNITGTGGSAGGGGTAGTGGTGGTGGTTYPDFCDITGVTMERETVTDGDRVFLYRGTSSFGTPFDEIIIQSFQYAPFNGPSAPGSYNLGGTNYKDCGLCVLAKKNCQFGVGCEKVFYANAGTLVIESMGGGGMRFKANLNDVFFREVDIDNDGYSIPVASGEKWCAHGTQIEVPEVPTQASCYKNGTGTDIGDNIASFKLQNCNGDWMDMHSFCGGDKALRMVVVTGWCPTCGTEVPKAAREANNTPGLGLLVMLGEDQYERPPTLSYCKQYASSHGVEAHRVFIDYGWQTLFSFINPHLGQEILLPWDAVVDGDNLEYSYCDTCNTGDMNTVINGLLND